MNKQKLEVRLETEFHVSKAIIIYKFILGLIELILGFGIAFGGKQIFDIYQNFQNGEFLENSHDLLAFILEKTIPYVLEHQTYVFLVLLALGLVKVIGAIGLFQKKHWGLDLLIGLTMILLPVDGYNLALHPSISELTFFLINLFIALYLVNFKPKKYFTDLKKRTRP